MQTLNLEQAAAFLHLHPITLLRKINSGEIPAAKIGKRWVLIELDLLDYLRSKYSKQASQGDIKESALCHSTKEQTLPIGGSNLRLTEKRYTNLLELPTKSRQPNMKQS